MRGGVSELVEQWHLLRNKAADTRDRTDQQLYWNLAEDLFGEIERLLNEVVP